MGRVRRLVGAGEVFHVTARGNGKVEIFADDRDRRRFLWLTRRTITARGWRVWAYCLMGNHVHLCVTTPQPDLSDGVRDVLGPYARYYNWRHERGDHLFGRRFGSVHVTSDDQLLAVVRYIARNPVRAKLVQHAADWQWSSFAEIASRRANPITDVDAVLSLLHERPSIARPLLDMVVIEGAEPCERELRNLPTPSIRAIGAIGGRTAAVATGLKRGLSLRQIATAIGVPHSTLWDQTRTRRTG